MVCVPNVNTEVFVAAVCKYRSRAPNDADITELLGVVRKSIMVGVLNVKNKFGNSVL